MRKLATLTAALLLAASPALAWQRAPSRCGFHQTQGNGSDYAAVQNGVPYSVGPTTMDTGQPNGSIPGPVWVPYLTTTVNGSFQFPDLWVTLSANTHIALGYGASAAPGAWADNIVWEQVQLLVDGKPVPFAGSTTWVYIDTMVSEIFDPTLGFSFDPQEMSMKSLTWSVPGIGNGPHTVEIDVRYWFHPTGTMSAVSAAAIFGPANLTAQTVHLN